MYDRKGYAFSYKKLNGGHCLVQLLNPVVTAYTQIPALKRAGIAQIRLDFFQESGDVTERLVKAYKSAVKAGQIAQIEGIIQEKTTKGALARKTPLE